VEEVSLLGIVWAIFVVMLFLVWMDLTIPMDGDQ
jgi:hypothetical protein